MKSFTVKSWATGETLFKTKASNESDVRDYLKQYGYERIPNAPPGVIHATKPVEKDSHRAVKVYNGASLMVVHNLKVHGFIAR